MNGLYLSIIGVILFFVGLSLSNVERARGYTKFKEFEKTNQSMFLYKPNKNLLSLSFVLTILGLLCLICSTWIFIENFDQNILIIVSQLNIT